MMNERIKELAVEAGAYLREGYAEQPNGDSVWMPDVRIDHCDMDLKKFAELIVQECLSIVDSNNPRPPGTTIMYSLAKDEYFDTGWQVAVETKSNQIKQHFGVEE